MKTRNLLVTAAVLVAFVIAGCKDKTQPSPTTQPVAKVQPGDLSPTPVRTEALDAEHQAKAQKLINGGIAFLLNQREADGGWSLGQGAQKPAITALVLEVLLNHPDYGADHEVVKAGFEALMKHRRADGGFYDPTYGMPNYTTAVAIMAMAAAHDSRFNDEITAAAKFLKGQQIVPGSESPDGQIIAEDNPMVGGVSYGQHGRPDLSNVGFWMEAMHAAEVPADDPAMKRAVEFLERTQNRSESNSMGWAANGPNDGGFVYAPIADPKDLLTGESKADLVDPNEPSKGLRSYGSMTYTGFKSMLYAGVDRNDPRVSAAWDWIRTYWRLDSNPNMPQTQSQQGLYYYYRVFAKALAAWGQDIIKDTQGNEHNWRQELIDELAKRVDENGSWHNDAPRWHENNPILVTTYAVLALQEATKK